MFLDFSEGLISPWVASCRYVVVLQNCSSDFFDIRYYSSSSKGFCCSGSVWRNDSDILVVVFSVVFPRWSGQSICCGVGFFRDILQDVVIFLEVHMPSSCLAIQVSW